MVNKSLTLFFPWCQGWQPPFACDVDRLHFTPRIQRLNELEVRPLFAFCLLQISYLQICSCGFIKPNLATSMISFWSATLKSSRFNSKKVINKKQGHWWKITVQMLYYKYTKVLLPPTLLLLFSFWCMLSFKILWSIRFL